MVLNGKEVTRYKIEFFETVDRVFYIMINVHKHRFGNSDYCRQFVSAIMVNSIWYEQTPESDFFGLDPEKIQESKIKFEFRCTKEELPELLLFLNTVREKETSFLNILPIYYDETLVKKRKKTTIDN